MRARGYSPFGASEKQDAVLDNIVDLAEEGTVGVFDLDGCLFDSRYRQVVIFHSFASRYGILELFQINIEHFIDWDMKRPMRLVGLSEEKITEIFPVFLKFWQARFFTDEWVSKDHAMPGARELVQACYDRGMYVVYLTGRDDNMRLGTEEGLRIFGLPYDRERTLLVTKPQSTELDEDYKINKLKEISKLGELLFLIDNEPINVNMFQEHHPEALVVWIETDHSPREIFPAEGITRIRSFYRTGWPKSFEDTPVQ